MKRILEHKKLLILNIVLVFLSVLCLSGFFIVSGTLDHVDSAKRWKGESELSYSYISCFMPVNYKTDENSVYSFGKTIDSKMVEASIEAPSGGSLWNFAYSGNGIITASTDRGSAEICAVGIGGDFFFFHRPVLTSGNYISGNDLMQDGVVLEKELAWKLFGATEVSGMELLINGNRYYVAGVIEAEKDFASKKAKIPSGGLYMSYTKLSELTDTGIDCYEAVLPSPVSGFALNLFKENFPAKNCDIIEVNKRYGIKNILSVAGSFGERSMRTDGIVFPEWENAARLTEDYCAVLFILSVIFILLPLGFGIYLGRKYGKIGLSKLWIFAKDRAEKIYDDHNRKIYERNLRKKEEQNQ